MGPVEEAVVGELEGVTAPLALAAAVLLLARRLDERPGDDAAVRLARELRVTMAEVRSHAGGGETEIERFLAELRIPEVRNTAE
jgi:hypothetical protein